MQITYSVVSQPHPHTTHGCLARTESNSFFWSPEPSPSDYATVAHNQTGAMVGIQKFFLTSIGEICTLDAIATFVNPLYQREGIARQLWSTSLNRLYVTHVNVQAISDRGKTLVEAVQAQFPHVSFNLTDVIKCRDGSYRKLRNLKGCGKGKRKTG